MTMIAVGQGLRGIANKGMGAVSRAEASENQQRMGIEAQKTAAESQTMGTGAGVGGMVGAGKIAKNASVAKDAVSSLNSQIGKSGTVGLKNGGLTFTEAGGETLLRGPEAAEAISKAAQVADAGTKVTTAVPGVTGGVAPAVPAVAAPVVGSAPVVGAATATESAAAASAAAGSTGTMASLATLAAPVAIGLGVAFLINKLFD